MRSGNVLSETGSSSLTARREVVCHVAEADWLQDGVAQYTDVSAAQPECCLDMAGTSSAPAWNAAVPMFCRE